MTKIAIISDIHGNKTALEAVLKDIRLRGIERIFCLGDIIGKGPQGSACIELIQKNCEQVVRGNWDVFIQAPSDNDFIQWFKERLTENDYQYLNSLPFNIDLELNGQLIRFFHASPRSEFERILPFHPIEKRLSMFENSEITNSNISDQSPDIVFYGDIHTTFLETFKNGILCNVGSVGNSLDLTTASYAILDGTYSTNSIQFVRVEYDQEAEIEIAKELDLPYLDKYYDEIMFGKYRNS
ncbi:metallophosphatase family protein [Bacillus sp. AFS002410]|uniref:metallophosphoesterase family protein n=1 Tax=Bacillus sp. AFS002410 TaxID=2033481 RepID=UPI000BF088FA|nr:metallophosphoesterase family protein [Bacillus sp. AFS002410]PEJ57171.1 metallophosphatase family protein [Bacillus sp. AFS002410]